MDDTRQDVRIATFGDGGEEVAADYGAAVMQPGRLQVLFGGGYDVGLFERDAAGAWSVVQDGGEEGAVAASDIDYGGETREVVGGDRGAVDGGGERGHRAVEQGGLVGMLAEIVVGTHSKDVLDRRFARPHALVQSAVDPPVPVSTLQPHLVTKRLQHVAPQMRRQRGQFEVAVLVLSEDTHARRRPKHAGQRRAMHAGRSGELVDDHRAV